GGLSIPCCACPHPDINLPEGWENASPEDWCILNLCDQLIIFVIVNFRWLYALFLAEDANFAQTKGTIVFR
ncbi:hypothetical protein L208DRAFT_1315785, partial [Tricholoma matsutake]